MQLTVHAHHANPRSDESHLNPPGQRQATPRTVQGRAPRPAKPQRVGRHRTLTAPSSSGSNRASSSHGGHDDSGPQEPSLSQLVVHRTSRSRRGSRHRQPEVRRFTPYSRSQRDTSTPCSQDETEWPLPPDVDAGPPDGCHEAAHRVDAHGYSKDQGSSGSYPDASQDRSLFDADAFVNMRRAANGRRSTSPESVDLDSFRRSRDKIRQSSVLANQSRQVRRRWTSEEEQELCALMEEYNCSWARITQHDGGTEGKGLLRGRSQVNLKDKARNLALLMVR